MLSLRDIQEEMAKLKDWSLEGGNAIAKTFSFQDFKEAMHFVNSVAEIAEKQAHHPDLLINYNIVRIVLSTHTTGSLTKTDFDMAREIDTL